MSSSGIVRWGGLAAMLGGTLGIVLAPILTYLLTTSSGAYLIFGKGYFLVYLGCLAGLMGLNAQRMRSPRRPKTERLGLRVTFVDSLYLSWVTFSRIGVISSAGSCLRRENSLPHKLEGSSSRYWDSFSC